MPLGESRGLVEIAKVLGERAKKGMTSGLNSIPGVGKRAGRPVSGQGVPAERAEAPDRYGSHFATLLSAKLQPVVRDGNKLYEVPIAVTGSWVKHGRRFEITPEDLAAMVVNFNKRQNEQIVIDYEHASETPEVAHGGPIPAAGWIHHLECGNRESGFGRGEDAPPLSPLPTPNSLRALVEWTPEAERLIQQGAYRFFSPAIDWGYRDKQTGEPQGATLTSGALTNHPFLEELPPIMLTDLDGAELSVINHQGPGDLSPCTATDGSPTTDVVNSNLDQPLESVLASVGPQSPLPNGAGEGGSKVNKLTLRKLQDGPLAGHHGVFDINEPIGYVNPDEFRDYLKQRVKTGEFNDLFDESELSESADRATRVFAERVGMPGASPNAVRDRLALAGAGSEGTVSSGVLRLFETVKDGVMNQVRAVELARDDKITLADYIAVQDAEKKLDEAVREGKILPRDRQFFFRDAVERPAEFADFVRRAVPVVRLGSQGIGSAGDISVDEEVEIRTRNLMKDEGLSYAKALKRVLASDKELERRYHGTHRREIGSTTASAVNGAEAAGITQ